MSATRLAGAAVLAALLACGDAAPPPRPAPSKANVASAAQVEAPAAEAKPAEPEWTYSSAGKRDPFRSFFTELVRDEKAQRSRCASPLGRFEVEQMKLVAVVTGLEDPVAMVEVPGGVGYSLRRGACVGKNGGVVLAVRGDGVVIAETMIRADGTRDTAQTVLRLPRQPGLTTEEQP